MSRSRKLGGGGGAHGDGDDLMITPLLDVFVALIPFLIMSMVMTKIAVVDVGVSKPVKAAQAQKDAVPFDLLVKIFDKRIDVMLNGKVVKAVNREGADAKDWAEQTRAVLVELKRKNPEQYKVRVEPEGKVRLQELMTFMDSARKLKPEDGEIIGKDDAGKPVKLQFLFPNVILRGIYG